MSDNDQNLIEIDYDTEPMSNHSDNPHFSMILERNLSRRSIVKGGLGAAVAGMAGAAGLPMLAEANPGKGKANPTFVPPNSAAAQQPTLGFEAVPIPGVRSDTTILPQGYKAQALIPWGTPLTGSYPEFKPVEGNTGAEQEQQVGSHHDGMHYFPSDTDPNGHGILCVNHEYVDQRVFNTNGASPAPRITDEVRKEIAGHGVSVVEIKRDKQGVWDVVRPSKYNRRVTSGTPMDIRGPVRRSDLVKTLYSPTGEMTRGTINNCAHGYTPWGTYLTCEENWAGYFNNRVVQARADALLNWFEDTQPALYPGRKASFAQGRYYARFYPETNRILGIFDEIQDQKVTNLVYTQVGSVFNDLDRVEIGLLADLLVEAGIPEDLTQARPREQARFGVGTQGGRYRWETAQSGEDQYVRFDASIKGADATEDYRNEPNGHGWVVEIDPWDAKSVPQKRTTLGRFAHEGAWLAPPQQGQRVVWYMGDDARNEYIYKFVSAAKYDAKVVEAAKTNPALRLKLGELYMDHGVLYVAKFNDDGSGEWLPLDINDAGFVAAAVAAGVEFKDQADVLVNTRLAADVAGATKMDRPEWGTVHPQTREVYFALTNNSTRTEADAANPRAPNRTGHIIRWRERGNRAWALNFAWDIFLLSGPVDNSQVLPAQNGPALTPDNIHGSADGLWIDQFGTLWIQTDMSGSQQAGTSPDGDLGANQMLAANPKTGEIKRFLIGPNDQETTGVVSTPDGKTLFVNHQHPGDRSLVGAFTSNWPETVYQTAGEASVIAKSDGPRPRSATIVITREDGGVVGL